MVHTVLYCNWTLGVWPLVVYLQMEGGQFRVESLNNVHWDQVILSIINSNRVLRMYVGLYS